MLYLVEIDHRFLFELFLGLGTAFNVETFWRVLELHMLGTRAEIFLRLGVLSFKVLQLSIQKLDVHNSVRPLIDRALSFEPRRGCMFFQSTTFEIGVLVLLVEWLAILHGILYLIDNIQLVLILP